MVAVGKVLASPGIKVPDLRMAKVCFLSPVVTFVMPRLKPPARNWCTRILWSQWSPRTTRATAGTPAPGPHEQLPKCQISWDSHPLMDSSSHISSMAHLHLPRRNSWGCTTCTINLECFTLHQNGPDQSIVRNQWRPQKNRTKHCQHMSLWRDVMSNFKICCKKSTVFLICNHTPKYKNTY